MFEFIKEKLTGGKAAAANPVASLMEEMGQAKDVVQSTAEKANQAKEAVQSAVTGAGTSPANGKYTVRPGDSLSKIAKAHNVPLKQIIAANPQIKNPDLIHPQDVINLG